jgi:hypothetical protein
MNIIDVCDLYNDLMDANNDVSLKNLIKRSIDNICIEKVHIPESIKN